MADTREAGYGIALLRVSLGIILLADGLSKAFVFTVFVFTVPGTVGFFQSIGYPGVLAYPVIAIEIIAGAMMIVGYQTRWAALAAIPVLIGATMVHLGNGWLFSNPKGGWEFPAFWTVALAARALLGDGALRLVFFAMREPSAASGASP